uniref:EHN domain-containing protein n=1 Tax=Steinernema glaseri TaxID=37863 RepID=A0A1I8APA3_9BILA
MAPKIASENSPKHLPIPSPISLINEQSKSAFPDYPYLKLKAIFPERDPKHAKLLHPIDLTSWTHLPPSKLALIATWLLATFTRFRDAQVQQH